MCLEGSIDKLKEYLKSVIEKAYEYRKRDENDKEITLKDVLVSLENADKDHRSPHILYTTNPIISTLAIVFLSNKVKKVLVLIVVRLQKKIQDKKDICQNQTMMTMNRILILHKIKQKKRFYLKKPFLIH